MPTSTSAQTGVVTAGSSPPGAPLAGTPAADYLWQFVICDRSGNELADISGLASAKTISRRLNRPAVATFKVPSWHGLVSTNHSDGSPILEVGNRALKVRRRDSVGAAWRIMFHGIVWHLEDSGDEDTIYTEVTAYDPMVWWRYRPARGYDYSRLTGLLTYNGNFSKPVFTVPGGTITGPELLRIIIDNSRVSTDASIGEGDLGLTIGTITPGAGGDVSLDLVDTPYTIADIHRLLTDTSQVDAWINPLEGGGGIMGELMAVDEAGSDKSWVHFQYGTGDYSVQRLRRERDMDSICNKLWYYLGPKLDKQHWRGNITATQADDGDFPFADPPQTAVLARMNASRSKYGVFMDIRIYDANENEAETRNRALYQRLWQTELYLRSEPREMLYVTPTRNAPFDVFDIEMGDTVRVSAFDGIRRGFTGAVQKVYGWTVQIDDDSVEQIVELATSPNNE